MKYMHYFYNGRLRVSTDVFYPDDILTGFIVFEEKDGKAIPKDQYIVGRLVTYDDLDTLPRNLQETVKSHKKTDKFIVNNENDAIAIYDYYTRHGQNLHLLNNYKEVRKAYKKETGLDLPKQHGKLMGVHYFSSPRISSNYPPEGKCMGVDFLYEIPPLEPGAKTEISHEIIFIGQNIVREISYDRDTGAIHYPDIIKEEFVKINDEIIPVQKYGLNATVKAVDDFEELNYRYQNIIGNPIGEEYRPKVYVK